MVSEGGCHSSMPDKGERRIRRKGANGSNHARNKASVSSLAVCRRESLIRTSLFLTGLRQVVSWGGVWASQTCFLPPQTICQVPLNRWFGNLNRWFLWVRGGCPVGTPRNRRAPNQQIALWLFGCGSKFTRRGYAGFGPCFHLPGFHFGTGFLSHSHLAEDLWTWTFWEVDVPLDPRVKKKNICRGVKSKTTRMLTPC